jgi:hypothetical protein
VVFNTNPLSEFFGKSFVSLIIVAGVYYAKFAVAVMADNEVLLISEFGHRLLLLSLCLEHLC